MAAVVEFPVGSQMRRPLGDIPCDSQLGSVMFIHTVTPMDGLSTKWVSNIPSLRWLQSYDARDADVALKEAQPVTKWKWEAVVVGIHPSKFAMHLRLLNELRRADKIPELHIGLRLMGTKSLIDAVKDNALDLLPVVDQEFIHAFLVGEEPTGRLMADMYDDLRDGPVRRKFHDHRVVYPRWSKPFSLDVGAGMGALAERLPGWSVQCAIWNRHDEFLSADTPNLKFREAQYETIRFAY